jgi:hypothetical protein
MFLRLRQICLVARELEAPVAQLCRLFGLDISIRDPSVEKHGLNNAVMPVGQTFLEVVAPFRDGTAAGRYLDRRGGDGGYMVILDTDDVERWRPQLDRAAAPIAYEGRYPAYHALHLHPKGTGGALLSLDCCTDGERLDGAWFPGGLDWQAHARTERVQNIVGAELQSPDPERLARRWSDILGRPAQDGRIALDHGELRFVAARDGRPEGLGGIDLAVADRAAILDDAASLGLAATADSVTFCGTRFYLR